MASANGKVILCGEHSVVYGGDALAVGLPYGVEARATAADRLSLAIDGRVVDSSQPAIEALTRVLRRLSLPEAAVDVELHMPVGVGLGASAAMAVAITRAVSELYQRTCDLSTLLAAAHVWESVFHGTPSGVDAACAALGGCISFNTRRGPVTTPVGAPLHLAIAVASPASLTKSMIERVAAVRQRDGAGFEQTLSRVHQIVDAARSAIANGEHGLLGALLDENHALLCQWGLSTPGIETACRAARTAGAFGAKLTGAGGGGCVLALCNAVTQPLVMNAWQRLSFQTLAVHLEPSSAQMANVERS